MPETLGQILEHLLSVSNQCENCSKRLKEHGKKWCVRCISIWARKENYEKHPCQLARKLIEMVGDEYAMATIEDIPEPFGREISETTKDIYLWGAVGVGKTFAMSAMIKHFLTYGFECERINFDGFCSKVRSTMNNNSTLTEHELVSQLANIDKLFIDDIGLRSKQETDFAYITFYNIIDQRQARRLQTFISTNKSIEQLTDSFDDRIASRLSTAVNIHMTGKDRRR